MKCVNCIKKITLWSLIIIGFSSCVDFFHPEVGSHNNTKLVVNGQVTDQEGYQTVVVSTTSTLEKPNFNPVSFCDVRIIDNKGNEFKLKESSIERGIYSVWMGKEYLKPGNSYQVKVVMPSGLEIVSDFDQMNECPEIDSIYYLRKDFLTSDPSKTLQGIQLYVDFDRKNTNSNFYKWEVVETWEHHSTYPITWYFDPETGWLNKGNPDFSKSKCWTTKKLIDFFTLSTQNIVGNKFKMIPIHYVDNQTQRLTYCYSALVYQYAVSEQAYRYWDDLKKGSNEVGGLYNTQPMRVKGNLRSTTDPELEVLGFFSAYTIKTKRIIVQKLDNYDACEPSCSPPRLENPQQPEQHKYEVEISGIRYILPDACVECDFMSGTTVKPSYWPY